MNDYQTEQRKLAIRAYLDRDKRSPFGIPPWLAITLCLVILIVKFA